MGIKDLLDILDDEPILPPAVVELAAWVAEYYACGAGEALSAAMPPFAWVESELRVRLTEAGRGRAAAVTLRPSTQRDALLALAEEAWTPLRSIAYRLEHAGGRRRGRAVPARALARALAAEGYLETDDVLRGSSSRFKTTKVAALTVPGQEAFEALGGGGEPSLGAGPSTSLGAGGLPVGARQREALAALAGVPDGVEVASLREQGISADVVQRLAARGWVSLRQERVDRDPFAPGAAHGREGTAARAPVTPTPEQAAALEQLLALVATRRFGCALLHGVTGSGKTEVYLRLAAAVRDAGRTRARARARDWPHARARRGLPRRLRRARGHPAQRPLATASGTTSGTASAAARWTSWSARAPPSSPRSRRSASSSWTRSTTGRTSRRRARAITGATSR